LKFEWDKEKNRINKIRHGVSFEDAETVFDDEYAVIIYDDYHSAAEERFVIIGEDIMFRELTVCHCYRGYNDEIIRIISARKATKTEISMYKGGIK
jgi:uncharacterized DUF497 family protein